MKSSIVLRSARALVLGGLALLAGLAQARPVDDIIDAGSLRVFAYSDYPPYSWEENGEARGIDIDIAREFAAALQVEVDFLIRGADENLDDDLRVNIWKGDLIHRQVADVMMHAPFDPRIDARNEFAVLMAPYFREEFAVLGHADELPEITTFGEFVARQIAVEVDTAGDFFLSNAFNGRLHPNIRRGLTFADAVALFRDGEASALMASRAQLEWVAMQLAPRETTLAQPPMPGIVRGGWRVGLAVKHDSRDLGYFLEGVLEDMAADGRLAEIFARYGVTYLEPNP